MLILYNSDNDKEKTGISIAAVFGVGLIGAHLVQNLLNRQYSIIHNLPFSWQTPQWWEKEKADILDCIRNLLKSPAQDHKQCTREVYPRPPEMGIKPAPTIRINFVWSAGKGGFGMEQSDALSEMDSFSEVEEMAITVLLENPTCQVRFHMLSSAGGLFEGQRNVNPSSLPAPGRPYGFLKLAQEKHLNACDDDLCQFIYRPTSIYGFAGLNHRLGLIPTLLWNGSKNKVSTIYGAPETLRDYVWADDVGAFIARMIDSKTSDSNQFILASGKPSSLFEIFNRIEKMLNKRLFCHYIKSGDNTESNTFSMKTHPAGWNPLDLETGIRKTYHAML